MKKVGLFAILTVFSVAFAQAQNPSDLIQFGAKGGVNFSTITGDGFENPSSRTGFHAGFVIEMPVNDRFSIQPEILYSNKGFTSEGTIAGTDYEAEYKMDYIDIPIMAKIYLLNGLNLQVGPQIGFRINEEVEYNTDLGDAVDEFDSDENDIGFGIGAGLGYKFASGFFIQGRYNYGFTEIYPDSESHNSVIQAGVGFMF
ncbi:MAG TPA: porin family protein [Flavobacteriaceae bacterium]|nr:porin family protein [Flavobacteriaceae bacterium]